MICVSIAEKTAEDCIRTLEDIEFGEVRIDALIKPSEAEVKRIFNSHKNLIATCRTKEIKDSERKNLLKTAIECGAKFVDIEAEATDDYKNEISGFAQRKECKIIISYHNYEKTPVKAELDQIVQWCFDSGADIAKIACMINEPADNARLLGLLDSKRKLVIIGMGEKGRVTRIVAPLLGSVFTFASSRKGRETAPGQIEIEELENIFKVLKYE